MARRGSRTDGSSQVAGLLDFYIGKHEEFWHEKEQPGANGELSPRPHWRCSSLGYCLRRQILERAGTPRTHEFTEETRRRFQAGDDAHWFLRKRLSRLGLLLGEEIEVYDPDLHLSGHIDAIWGGEPQEIPERWRLFRKPDWIFFLEHIRKEVAQLGPFPVEADEIKSMNTWAMSQVDQHGRTDQMTQLAGYKILGERHPGSLPAVPERWAAILIGRDSLNIRAIPLEERWVEEAKGRLNVLNEAWTSGNWPACTCGTTPGIEWEAKYCAFVALDGDGCCGQNLLERLEASLT